MSEFVTLVIYKLLLSGIDRDPDTVTRPEPWLDFLSNPALGKNLILLVFYRDSNQDVR